MIVKDRTVTRICELGGTEDFDSALRGSPAPTSFAGKTEGPGNMLYTIGTASRSGIEVLSATKLVDAIQATTVRGVENPGGKLEAGGGCVLVFQGSK